MADPPRPPATPLFTLVVLLTLAVYGFVAVVLVRPDLIAGVLGHETAGHIRGHFRSYQHRTHDLTFGFLMGPSVVGMLAQLRAPAKNVAGQWMAVVPWVALLLAFGFATTWLPFGPAPILGASTLIATILHPTGRNLFDAVDVSRVNRAMIALVAVAAVPLVAFAATNVGLQRTVVNDHAALGHYGFMAAFGITVIGVGLLASLRPVGWRLTAWIAAGLPALLGIVSLLYPDADSSLDPMWALAAIGWGVAFGSAARLSGDAAAYGPFRSGDTAHPATPRWAKVAAIIALLVVVLFVILLVIGGPGGHGPGRHISAAPTLPARPVDVADAPAVTVPCEEHGFQAARIDLALPHGPPNA